MEVRLPRGRVLRIDVALFRRRTDPAAVKRAELDPEVEEVLRRARRKQIQEYYESRRAPQGET